MRVHEVRSRDLAQESSQAGRTRSSLQLVRPGDRVLTLMHQRLGNTGDWSLDAALGLCRLARHAISAL